MIKLGDRITVKPATFDVPGKDGKPKAIPGTVVYVHPGGRYCVLEFDIGRREPVTITSRTFPSASRPALTCKIRN